ncbi:anti-anti-sigma factor [Streptomyces sp. SAI-117]|uniref:STAS domain-containing protein n=1 Tax=unclassified Streptomyces TaxID=2593676 RepID=UPI0024771055|nr:MULTISPECIES: STAS domain-containing protein [unclassified Streptomyces]MDH6553965.1 anti-anti-sigma factor [Streptomyces sp. SAI-041]MDH6573043.1 anti-anti-sigma factor [Streptomyces sp. SAI-117]MDH6581995.1 anti-anti-sigma factor [Streptomyces sp. SAI-133]
MSGLSPAEFAVTVTRENATLVARVDGELDYDTSDDLVTVVTENLNGDDGPPGAVRLDFSGLTWIDSSGLSALLMIHRRARALGADFHLDNRPEVLERMLLMTNVLDHLLGRDRSDAPGGRVLPGPGGSAPDGIAAGS